MPTGASKEEPSLILEGAHSRARSATFNGIAMPQPTGPSGDDSSIMKLCALDCSCCDTLGNSCGAVKAQGMLNAMPKSKAAKAAKYKQKRLGAKAVKGFERNSSDENGILNRQAATNFRAVSARSNYLAQDRPDGSYSSKELCREFASPNELSLTKLKRLGRYYKGRPRLVYKFPFAQAPAERIEVFTDTDFAGCSQTRRSTSGGCAVINNSLVKHWSKTQSTIALSSGESELVGIGSGMAQALGLRSLAADMGWNLKLKVYSDATAAIGIAKRRGLGKIRHLATTDLWIQEKVRNGDIDLQKVLGADNPADIFTKYLDKGIMDRALIKLNCHFMDGRAKCAPATMGLGQS